MFSIKSLIARFSDYFNKEPGGNIGKFLTIASIQFQDVKQTLDTIRLYRSIDDAKGLTLDLIGENLNQKRGALSDEMYRVLLKTKIKRNLSDGSVEHLLSIITDILAIPPQQVELVEKQTAIAVRFEDYGALGNAEISAPELITIMRQVKGAGVKLESVAWDGTFKLGDAANPEVVADKGLGDVNNSMVGGTLGLYYSDKDIRNIPI